MIKATSYGELWRNEYLKVKAENEKLREQVLHLTMKIGGSARPQFHTADNPYPKSKPVPPLTQAEIAAMDMALRADDRRALPSLQQGAEA